MTSFRPVSETLEADLRDSVRRQGIVVWLDLDNHYGGFVDRLMELRESGHLPYDVRSFRGSHLELMLALEPLAGGVDKTRLVIHLPGFTEETVRSTPMLELYLAGVRYRKRLDTLVTEAAAGRVRPEQIAAFREQGRITLDSADAWLAAVLEDAEGGLVTQLRAIALPALMEDLLTNGFVAQRVASVADQGVVWDRLAAGTGLTEPWREECLPTNHVRAEDMAFAAASWAMCVEYVHDLARLPVAERLAGIRSLPKPLVAACCELATYLRERHPDFYHRTADETEAWLAEEIEAARAEDLGQIDTFRFEEATLLKAALQSLAEQRWDTVRQWAEGRLDGGSFWLGHDISRRSAWQLVADAARLGESLSVAGSLGNLDGLDVAVQQYVARGAAVDQAHRHLEQRRLALLYPQLPEFDALRVRLDGMRLLWRAWADAWARDFNRLCRQHGFLPPAALQQRTLFEDVVRPLTQEPGLTVLLVVDALRYEMAEELYRTLSDTPLTTAHLRARLAELPTVTEVGMNVLAPVIDRGRLRPVLTDGAVQGFSTGVFSVSAPETRRRAMHDRVGGATCPWLTLEEVLTRDATSLKQSVARARLVIVHSREIDDAGEKGAGPAVFEHVMQKLRAAWRLLRDAGAKRFVFTADHGFLLLDDTTAATQSHGLKVDPKRRYVYSTIAADHAGEVRVPLSELGYEAEGHLIFAETTAVYETGQRTASFVHGGNSLQERVIPVLTLSHRSPTGSSTLRYSLTASVREGVAGLHCLAATVQVASQLGLDFGSNREVELGLRVPEVPGVQVELCQTRNGARLAAGGILATVGQEFELFFRLSGAVEDRVLVELYHPGAEADVAPCTVDGRFAVALARAIGAVPAEPARVAQHQDWLQSLPEGGVRQLFAHLAEHGTATESEAAAILGSQRAMRRFAGQFEQFAAQAPFGVRIDVVAGVKRYVREGSSS